jgi:hypothetical protein
MCVSIREICIRNEKRYRGEASNGQIKNAEEAVSGVVIICNGEMHLSIGR